MASRELAKGNNRGVATLPRRKKEVDKICQTLLPDDVRAQLPKLYANEALGMAAPAVVKFFTPDASWTWYASEFDGEDLLFGLVIGHVAEFGYFSLSELEGVRGPLGLPVERALNFTPASLGELRDHFEREGWAR